MKLFESSDTFQDKMYLYYSVCFQGENKTKNQTTQNIILWAISKHKNCLPRLMAQG